MLYVDKLPKTFSSTNRYGNMRGPYRYKSPFPTLFAERNQKF